MKNFCSIFFIGKTCPKIKNEMNGKEIICVNVGQAGNAIGSEFIRELCLEHAIDVGTGTPIEGRDARDTQVRHEKLSVFFENAEENKRIARAICVDTEPGVLDVIRAGPCRNLFRPESFVHSTRGAGGNWAKGFYTEGAEIADVAMDVARRQAEACDCLQGFQLCHAAGGGTGAGLGTLILSKLREEFPDRVASTATVVPSFKTDVYAEPYNFVLAIHQLTENADIVHVLDNEAFYDMCFRTLQLSCPTYVHLNRLAVAAMSEVTCSLRFSGILNQDLRKTAMNLIPFPRLHFLVNGHIPISGEPISAAVTVPELACRVFEARNLTTAADPRRGKCLSAAVLFRGRVNPRDVCQESLSLASLAVGWIPDSTTVASCSVSRTGIGTTTASLTGNSTVVIDSINRIGQAFDAMFRRKAFLHWFTGEGMDEMEFVEAKSNLDDLVSEYQQYQEA